MMARSLVAVEREREREREREATRNSSSFVQHSDTHLDNGVLVFRTQNNKSKKSKVMHK